MAPPLVNDRRLWAGLALLAALAPAPLAAQAPDGARVYYSRATAFLVPFVTDPADRRIQAVLLHVSEDGGRTYNPAGSALPSERSFRFQARHDGWYWFAVQTRDADNRYYPPNLTQVQPGIKVCVDTKPPVVTLRPAAPREGTVAVEWDVQDDNLDLYALRLEYRPPGGRDWLALPPPQLARGQQGWNPGGTGPVEVRLLARDKAGNVGQGTTSVTPGAFAPGSGVGVGPAPGEAPRGKVIHVRSLSFQLNYEIENVGPSKVKNVEIWWTTRDKRRWEKYTDDAKEQGPYTIKVERQGTYGFTLIPRSGVGLAERPPEPGMEPQIWVEVDLTRPVVSVNSVVVSVESGKLTVQWSASDRFLRANPISISYADKPEGPWVPLPGATRLENGGSFTCPTEGLPFLIYVRVEASDEAGNVGSAVYREPVKIDLKVPRIRSVDVKSAEAPGLPPQ